METTNPAKNLIHHSAQVLSQFKSELSNLAAEHGIHWSKLTSAIRFDGKPKPANALPLNSAVNPAYQGNTFVEVTERVTKDGNRYPIVHFKTFAYGETVQTWDGQQAWQQRERECTEKKGITRRVQFFSAFKTEFQQQLPKLSADNFTGCYLAHKGFVFTDIPTDFELRRGTDKRGGFIAYLIQNSQQQTVGFQKLYDQHFIDGSGKRRDKDYVFYPNSKNGSYAWLGTPPKNVHEQIDCTEGLATGLTAYLANDGKPVVICLDAPNLPYVIAALSQTYSNLRLLGDNDINDTANSGNVGLFSVIKAARFSNASVVVPELDGKKCDFNDVHLALGIDEVRRQLESNTLVIPSNSLDYHKLLAQYTTSKKDLEKITDTLCFLAASHIFTPQDHRQYTKEIAGLRYGSITAISKLLRSKVKARREAVKYDNSITNFDGIERHDCNGLSNEEIAAEIATQKGVWLDYRAMAMGKTKLMELLASLYAGKERVAYIAHRVSLTRNGSIRLDLHHYQDGNSSILSTAVCVDSIIKRDLCGVSVLFGDEIRQLLEHVLHGKTVKNRLAVYNQLVALVRVADLVIFADADLNQFTVDWVKRISNKPIHAIDTEQANTGKTLHSLADASEVVYRSKQDIVDGKNLWITTDSIQQAKKLKLAFAHLLREDEILLLTQKNKGDTQHLAFSRNPNAESAKYRVVIHTPVISSGVSIENNHFHAIYAVFCNVIAPNEMLQSIARVRAVKDIFVSFKANHAKDRPTEVKDLIDGEANKRGRFNSQTNSVELTDFDVMRLTLIANRNKAMNNYKSVFLVLAQMKGYNLEQIHTESNNAKTDYKDLSKTAKVQQPAEILNAEQIDDTTAQLISKTPNPTQAQSNALDRYSVTETTGKAHDTINEIDVNFYLKGGNSIIANHELLSADTNQLKELDRANHQTRDKWASQTSKQYFFTTVINSLLNKQIDKAMAQRVCEWLQENHQELAANNLGNYAKVAKYPIRQLNTFLKRCGYELENKQCTDDKRLYFLVINAQIADYVANRKLRQRLTSNQQMESFLFK